MASKETLNKNIYLNMLREYKYSGNNVIWVHSDNTEIKIEDMDDSHIRNTINMLKRKPSKNSIRIAWIHIFEDVLYKRRFNKINKITNNIK